MNSTDRLIAFVVDRLPDSIGSRREVLTDLVAAFPKASEPRALLGSLDRHLADQRELQLEAPSRGSARLGDQPMERGAR